MEVYNDQNWHYQGLIWGGIMYIVIELIVPYFNAEPYNTDRLIGSIFLWGIGGLIYGYYEALF